METLNKQSKQYAELIRTFPTTESLGTFLATLSYDDIVSGRFPGCTAFGIFQYGFYKDVNGKLPDVVWQTLVASRVRRCVRSKSVRVRTAAGRVLDKHLHIESISERRELISAVIEERLGVAIPKDRKRQYSKRPKVCVSTDNLYWALPSVIQSSDRYLFNKGTPYWQTITYRLDSVNGGYNKLEGKYTDDDIQTIPVYASHGMPLASHYQPIGTILIDEIPNMIQAKIIVRHLGDTASQYPNMSHEEFTLVREKLGEKHRVVWDLLARGSFTHAQIAAACGISKGTVQDAIKAACKVLGRDVVGDDDNRTGIEQATTRARYQTPAVQRKFKTVRVPNTGPTLTERLQGITDCLTRPATQTCTEQFDSFDDWYLHGTKNTRTSWVPVQKAAKL